MAATIYRLPQKTFPEGAEAKRRCRPHPAQTSLTAGQRSLRRTFQARLGAEMVDRADDLWSRDVGYLSVGFGLHLATQLAGNYLRRGCVDGWTPETFFAIIQQLCGRRVSERTARKWAGMVLSAGFFVAQRAHGNPRGTLLRIVLCDDIIARDRPGRMQAAADRRRQVDRDGKRRRRAHDRQQSLPRDGRSNHFLPTDLDQIDQDLANLGSKPGCPRPVRSTPTPSARSMEEAPTQPTSAPQAKTYKIPPTPTPSAQGRQDFPCESLGKKAGKGAPGTRRMFTSPEALEDHLYRHVCHQPLSAGPKLRAEVGDEIYEALLKADTHGIQGLKGRTAEMVQRACRGVARAHGPRPTNERQRAERYRRKVDRRAAAAAPEAIREAAEAILGPVTAAAINPRHLAYQGLSLPAVEAVFGRGQRCLKVGSQGPQALRTPGATNAYFLAAFRRDNLAHGRAPGRNP